MTKFLKKPSHFSAPSPYYTSSCTEWPYVPNIGL